MPQLAQFVRSRHTTVRVRELAVYPSPGCGWGLPIGPDGIPEPGAWVELSADKIEAAIIAGAEVAYTGAEYPELVPGSGRCQCGRTVTIESHWANGCDCGREYDGSGRLLAPRSQWGDETGESPADLCTVGELADY